MTYVSKYGNAKTIEIYRVGSSTNIWTQRFMSLAREISTWSKDPVTKVGSVIVNVHNEIVSTGYNGFARNVNEQHDRWQRPEKYRWVVHAEANAIFQAAKRGTATEGCSLYCTLFPCTECTNAIIQAGIKEVIVPPYEDKLKERPHWEENFMVSRDKLLEANIQLVLTD